MSTTSTIKRKYELRGRKVERIVRKAITDKVIHDDNPCIDLYSMSVFRSRLKELRDAFGLGVQIMHGLAIKANPIRGVLHEAMKLGFGAECASFPEVCHALSLGFAPRKIIYDSPCKSARELEQIIQAGVYINLDNEDEIDKVNRILTDKHANELDLASSLLSLHQKQFGLRINPMVGCGTIESTSTATAWSKFGLPWTSDTHEDLFQLFKANPWIQGIHVHVGSQGIALQKLVQGVERAVELADSVNKRLGRKQIQVIDIGGGLPADYQGEDHAFAFADYARELRLHAPGLFAYDILTEFGRSVFVKPGITISQVAAVKTWTNQRIAITFTGANQFLRSAYLPHQWKHVMSVFTSTGELKTADMMKHDIAGPLCFSGDYLGRGVTLPRIDTGDYIVLHDTGGYTTSMYSKYNSRRASAMYAYEDDDQLTLTVLKHRETCAETLAFWGVDPNASTQPQPEAAPLPVPVLSQTGSALPKPANKSAELARGVGKEKVSLLSLSNFIKQL